jgi:hypothetical protein
MAIPTDKKLYEKVKQIADKTYDRPSAYKSGFIVKTYKGLGGTYTSYSPKGNLAPAKSGMSNSKQGLKQWFKEKWIDVGHKAYPVYRPTIRVNKKTPLTISEIDKTDLKKQIALKQKIKGKHLPPFKAN